MFATQDKISGVDIYKVREGSWGFYKQAESPYLLKYQKLDKKIYVKAIDKGGNERIVVLNPQMHTKWWGDYWLAGIIMLAIIFRFIIGKKYDK